MANLHTTIVIDKPGVYDYEGTMHTWVGAGECGFFGHYPPVMDIRVSNVTVKNFGFKRAIYGIRIGNPDIELENIRLENIEGFSCFKGIQLPRTVKNLSIADSSFTSQELPK